MVETATGLTSWQAMVTDDQGRPMVITSVDGGKTSSDVQTYTALGQPQNETFGSAGNVTVAHGYYPATPPAACPTGVRWPRTCGGGTGEDDVLAIF